MKKKTAPALPDIGIIVLCLKKWSMLDALKCSNDRQPVVCNRTLTLGGDLLNFQKSLKIPNKDDLYLFKGESLSFTVYDSKTDVRREL